MLREERERRSASARRTYAGLAPANGTIAEIYLRARAITLPLPDVLRCGLCSHRKGGVFPALAALVVNLEESLFGLHTTFLKMDGAKAEFDNPDHARECRGSIKGGAIRLAPLASELLVAEGIETALSAMQIFEVGGWSAVSAGGLKSIELPPAVRSVVIAADNDRAGWRSARAAYERLIAEGRTVRVMAPEREGWDFNDQLRYGG